jgi:glucose-6-phosphate isomerase
MYPGMAKSARDEGFDEIADWFETLAMRDLFANDPERAARMSVDAAGLHLDYSKHIATDETLAVAVRPGPRRGPGGLARAHVRRRAHQQHRDRAVLHVALRNRTNRPILVDGADVMPEVNACSRACEAFSERVRAGDWKGFTGKPITDVVNIGIGGSNLGRRWSARR